MNTEQQFKLVEVAGEILNPLTVLHRAEDSHIAFVRKMRGQFENLFMLRAGELHTMLPAIASWLLEDAYFSVNGYYRAAPYNNLTTGLPGVWRREKYLRYLNACYVDLDVGRDCGTGDQCQSWRQAAAIFSDLMEAGHIPQCSIFARSGRGLYVFWLLHDEADDTQPSRYGPETVALYKQIQKCLTQRLTMLAADANAVDAARVLRVPGTLHSVTGNPAIYTVQLDADGRPYSYTLRELANFFGLPDLLRSLPRHTWFQTDNEWQEEIEGRNELLPEETIIAGDAPAVRQRVPARVNGARARHAKCAQDLVTLEQWQGGWTKPGRRRHLLLYANFLRGAGESRKAVLQAVTTMAANCHPPYPSDASDTTLQNIVDEVFSGLLKTYRNVSLCEWLGVTAELARELELQTIVPDEVAEERRLPPGGTRKAAMEARRSFIRDYIDGNSGVPSSRAMLKILEQNGFKTNRQTVNDDLSSLGYKVTDSRHRRPGRPATVQEILELDTTESRPKESTS